jgi:hypothetical protein
MNLTVEIPDDVAKRLSAAGGDLSRRALEAFLAEEYKHGRLTTRDLRRVLGLDTSEQIDEFLKAHKIRADHALEQLDGRRENKELASIAHLQKTDPQEWARQFDAWVDSHDPNTPVLSDEAMSRESIYPDRM